MINEYNDLSICNSFILSSFLFLLLCNRLNYFSLSLFNYLIIYCNILPFLKICFIHLFYHIVYIFEHIFHTWFCRMNTWIINLINDYSFEFLWLNFDWFNTFDILILIICYLVKIESIFINIWVNDTHYLLSIGTFLFIITWILG